MEQILGYAPALSFEELLRPANLAHARAVVEAILRWQRSGNSVSWQPVADGMRDYPNLTTRSARGDYPALRNHWQQQVKDLQALISGTAPNECTRCRDFFGVHQARKGHEAFCPFPSEPRRPQKPKRKRWARP